MLTLNVETFSVQNYSIIYKVLGLSMTCKIMLIPALAWVQHNVLYIQYYNKSFRQYNRRCYDSPTDLRGTSNDLGNKLSCHKHIINQNNKYKLELSRQAMAKNTSSWLNDNNMATILLSNMGQKEDKHF